MLHYNIWEAALELVNEPVRGSWVDACFVPAEGLNWLGKLQLTFPRPRCLRHCGHWDMQACERHGLTPTMTRPRSMAQAVMDVVIHSGFIRMPKLWCFTKLPNLHMEMTSESTTVNDTQLCSAKIVMAFVCLFVRGPCFPDPTRVSLKSSGASFNRGKSCLICM